MQLTDKQLEVQKWEIWKDVIWYEWLYMVSNLWRIYSTTKWDMLSVSSVSYRTVCLSNKGKVKYIKLHRLVATTFIKNLENKPCINHIDWDKLNNKADNLEWCTYSENNMHSSRVLKQKKWFQVNKMYLWKKWESHPTWKPIVCYDMNMQFIRRYNSIMAAAYDLGKNDGSTISWALRWKWKTAYWFIWKYDL